MGIFKKCEFVTFWNNCGNWRNSNILCNWRWWCLKIVSALPLLGRTTALLGWAALVRVLGQAKPNQARDPNVASSFLCLGVLSKCHTLLWNKITVIFKTGAPYCRLAAICSEARLMTEKSCLPQQVDYYCFVLLTQWGQNLYEVALDLFMLFKVFSRLFRIF